MVAIPRLPTGAPRPHRRRLEFLLDGFQGLFRVLYSLQLWRLLTVRHWVGGGHTVDCPGSHAAPRLGSLAVDTTSDFPRVTHGSLCVDSGAGLAHRAFPLAARHRAHGLLPQSRHLKETTQAEREISRLEARPASAGVTETYWALPAEPSPAEPPAAQGLSAKRPACHPLSS